MKCCGKCGENKPLTEYYKQKSNKDGLYTYCKSCKYNQQREWFNKNREENLEYHARYRQENKEKIDSQIAEWHEKNPESRAESRRAWKNRNRDRIRKEHAEYKRNNRDKSAKWTAQRRANVLQASDYGNEDLNELVLQEAYAVAKKRTESTGVKHHVDHVIPLGGKEVCGFHVWNNLRVIPAYENTAKGNKLIEDLL